LIGRRARLPRLPGLGLRIVQVARRVGRHRQIVLGSLAAKLRRVGPWQRPTRRGSSRPRMFVLNFTFETPSQSR
jgi:hypothetical protein